MLERFPFSWRVALLLGLMTVAAAVDFLRRGKQAARHREYGFILIAGVIGGLVGYANDCVTSAISPDYFILGKGLAEGDGLRWRAAEYGCKVGFSAGVIGGAICLFFQPRKAGFPTEQLRRMLLALWMPLAGAALLGLALPLIAGRFDPLRLSVQLDTLLNARQISRFKTVWWIHTGLYAGLSLGLAGMVAKGRRKHEEV